ncbi:MAG: hypothetical protein K6F68_05005 [Clostridiales bacterium]|nr:hypothetical protein [Clostridiales bacterium]
MKAYEKPLMEIIHLEGDVLADSSTPACNTPSPYVTAPPCDTQTPPVCVWGYDPNPIVTE